MESIIIFTNARSIKKKGYGNFDVGAHNSTEVVPVGNTRQFIVAFDGLANEQLNAFVKQVLAGAVYVLHHSTPNEGTLDELKEKLQEKGIDSSRIILKESDHATASTYGRLKVINANRENESELQKIFDALKGQICVLSALTQLHKHLILGKLKGTPINEAMLDELKSENIEIAINTIPEAKRKDEKVLLDHISNEVEKYGA